MANVTKVSKSIPSSQRSQLITAVAAGDRIDVQGVLGRPAKGLQIHLTATTDNVTYRLNNLLKIRKHNESSADQLLDVWASGADQPLFNSTGQVIETQSGLLISSIEIDTLTLSTGTVVEIVVW